MNLLTVERWKVSDAEKSNLQCIIIKLQIEFAHLRDVCFCISYEM